MAYYLPGYSAGYNPQYYNNANLPSGGTGNDYMSAGGEGGQYNMQAPSTYAPVNQGGPGNPNGANNMAKPMLPRFNPGFQNNKGPAPLQGYNPNSPAQLDQRAIAADPQGFAQWQREAAAAGYNYGNSGQQGQQGVQSGPPASLLQSFNSLMGGGQQGGYNGSGINPPIPREDNYYRRPNMGGDPFNQYGYAGQSPSLGRYQPPMMSNPNDPSGGWLGGGGYAYNIPNSYGSGQWNQFNSTDRPSRNFGQTQNAGNFALGNVRYSQPAYQSPFASGDPSRGQNYYAYLSTLGQQPQQPRYTQPGTPDQPGPVT